MTAPRDTLSTLDLHERPGQRVWTIRHVRHDHRDGPIELAPGERAFSSGDHHGHYAYTVAIEELPDTEKSSADNTKARLASKA
jgi:hypothetical protein